MLNLNIYANNVYMFIMNRVIIVFLIAGSDQCSQSISVYHGNMTILEFRLYFNVPDHYDILCV